MTVSKPAPGTGGQPNSAVLRAPRVPFWAGRWYFAITIASVGLLAWVPFVHAAARLRRRLIAVLAGIYGAGAVASVVLFTMAPTGPDAQTVTGIAILFPLIGELLLLSMVIVGCIQQVSLRQKVYSHTPRPGISPSEDPALTAALAARARRDATRRLATDDPLIARELRIGRPDLPRTYDDGGLVDLNSAPAAIIAEVCDLTADTADHIVTTRTTCGGFNTVDDVLTLADIPISTWDTIRDRGIIIAPLA